LGTKTTVLTRFGGGVALALHVEILLASKDLHRDVDRVLTTLRRQSLAEGCPVVVEATSEGTRDAHGVDVPVIGKRTLSGRSTSSLSLSYNERKK
jgi:hypothetical protein